MMYIIPIHKQSHRFLKKLKSKNNNVFLTMCLNACTSCNSHKNLQNFMKFRLYSKISNISIPKTVVVYCVLSYKGHIKIFTIFLALIFIERNRILRKFIIMCKFLIVLVHTLEKIITCSIVLTGID